MWLVRMKVALVGLGGLGVAACAGILGIGDRSLDPDAGADGAATCSTSCPMATGLNRPWAMAADEANVYWTELGDPDETNGSVKACPVTGCGSGPTVYALLQSTPNGLAIDAQNVYWGTASGPAVDGGVWACAIGGCNGQPTRLATGNSPYGIAVDSQYVYWADYSTDIVSRVPTSGGKVQQLLGGGTTNPVDNGEGCIVDPSSVYINDSEDNVFRLPIGGGTATQLYASGGLLDGTWGLAVDSDTLYYGTPGAIFAIDKTTTSGATALVPNVTAPIALQLDPAGGTLYWVDFGSANDDGYVGKIPLDGGASVLLAQGAATPQGVAVNSTQVFWISYGTLLENGSVANSGTLNRITK